MSLARATAIALVALHGAALADGDPTTAVTASAPATDPLDVRLTLSSFLYQQTGKDAAPIVDGGSTLQNASPVRRVFGDMRGEVSDSGFTLYGRVRETTSEDYQSGAVGGSEYEIRTLDYRLGSRATNLTIGRQYISAVGQTKIDGLSFNHELASSLSATAFVGAFPQLGSRSLDTDYIHFKDPITGGNESLIVPVVGGLGVTYQTLNYHGELGAAALYAPESLPDASADEKSRVFAASSGYWRPASILDIYHFALLDVVGADGVSLTDGSVGIDLRPISNVVLSATAIHISTDLLQIDARNYLTDPDPSAIGVVQNNVELLKIVNDMVRGSASVSFAEQRFEISGSGGLHLRPSVTVPLPLSDGTTGAFVMPEERSIDATVTILDRRSIAGLRIALSGSIIDPLGTKTPNRSRGTVGRLTVSRTFAQQRGQIEADVMAESFDDIGTAQQCSTYTNALACYGSAHTTAGQAGALGSWRVGREWLVLADFHVGYQKIGSTFVTTMDPTNPDSPLVDMPIHWPGVVSFTAFARVQWRFR